MKVHFNIIIVIIGLVITTSFKSTTFENKGYTNYDTPLYQLMPQPYNPEKVSLGVQKGTYTVSFYYDGLLLKTYPCVFGKDPYQDKQMKGDYRTPEGNFKIDSLREHFIWGYFIGIDYPNEQSWQKFEYRKQNNLIPYDAEIGGSVGFHGVVDGLEVFIDERNNWTEGCISLKNKDINEIAAFIQPGINVNIRY